MVRLDEGGKQVHPGNGIKPDGGAAPGGELSGALKDYVERVAARVPLKPEHALEIRETLESNILEHSDALLERGYKPYAVEDEVLRRMGDAETVADRYNRLEATRSWFRDPLCIRALWRTAVGFIGLATAGKLAVLATGLIAHDPQTAYNLELQLFDAVWIAALLSGVFAFQLYRTWSGNRYRYTPFVALSVGLFILNGIVGCDLNFISQVPEPSCRVFLWFDMHSILTAGRTHFVYEFELSGMSMTSISSGIMRIAPTYTTEAFSMLSAYVAGIIIAMTYLIERIAQRPFERFERV